MATNELQNMPKSTYEKDREAESQEALTININELITKGWRVICGKK